MFGLSISCCCFHCLLHSRVSIRLVSELLFDPDDIDIRYTQIMYNSSVSSSLPQVKWILYHAPAASQPKWSSNPQEKCSTWIFLVSSFLSDRLKRTLNQNEFCVIIYSHSCHFQPIWFSYFFGGSHYKKLRPV